MNMKNDNNKDIESINLLAEKHDELEAKIEENATEIEALLITLKERCKTEKDYIKDYIDNTEELCQRLDSGVEQKT